MRRLEGKVALVTGAARGQGEAEARLFVEEGAQVVLADVLVDKGRAVADDLDGAALFVELDVASPTSWRDAVSRAERAFGTINILVNNAAVSCVKLINDTSASDFQRVFEINLLGPFQGMQAIYEGMRSTGGGSIVNIASIAAKVGIVHQGAYGATKAGLSILTRTAALEWAPHGIRVNAILPGLIDTPMVSTNAAHQGADRSMAFHDANPIGRAGHVKEVAFLALYLASEESSFTTGAEYVVDGGSSAGKGFSAPVVPEAGTTIPVNGTSGSSGLKAPVLSAKPHPLLPTFPG